MNKGIIAASERRNKYAMYNKLNFQNRKEFPPRSENKSVHQLVSEYTRKRELSKLPRIKLMQLPIGTRRLLAELGILVNGKIVRK
jgi:hypothetical protein